MSQARGSGCWWVLLFSVAFQPQAGELPIAARRDAPWQITSFAEEAGVTQRRVFDLAFEPGGAVWIAASDGLRWYDGYGWRHYTSSNGLPSSLVRCVQYTRGGELWVGTDVGAGVFFPKEGRFETRGSAEGLAGPSVRRIVEDPDGSLWFCSDRWPETDRPGGVSQYQQGRWRKFGLADGLPDDHVMAYFRDSSGQQYAGTTQGLAVRRGDRWALVEEPGLPAGAYIWGLTESADGVLLVQASFPGWRVLARRAGRWSRVEAPGFFPMRTSRGEVLASVHDRRRGVLRLARWDGNAFVPAAAEVPAQVDFVEQMRQGPDGAVWVAAYGTLLRWEYEGGAWVPYDSLPGPRFVDGTGAVWFADANTVVVKRKETFTVEEGLQGAIWRGAGNEVWAFAGNALVRLSGTNRTQYLPEETGLQAVYSCVGGAGGADDCWFIGRGPENRTVLVQFDGASWKRWEDPRLAGFVPSVARRDPRQGVWVLWRAERSTATALARAGAGEMEVFTKADGFPAVYNPVFEVDPNGLWLLSAGGVHRADPGAPGVWGRIDALSDRGFRHHAFSAGESLITYDEGALGQPGIAVFRGGEVRRETAWLTERPLWSQVASDGSVLFAQGGAVHVRTAGGGGEVGRVLVPTRTAVESFVLDPDGTWWIGTAEGTVRYVRQPHLPGTLVSASAAEVSFDGRLRLDVRGVERFAPRSAPGAFQFTVRVDDGPERDIGSRPVEEVAAQELRPGRHRMVARARDAFGRVDPQGAEWWFTVQPRPLEQRPWFRVLVFLVLGAIVLLGGLALQRALRLSQVNLALQTEIREREHAEGELRRARAELEQRVLERTADLTRSNEALSREIADREKAQRALMESEEKVRQLNADLERRVVERTAELSAANRELEAFCYSVSHDLRSPLRAINGFSQILVEDYKDQLDAEAVSHLTRVRAASKRMGQLIDDLLALSRTTRAELVRRPVDLTRMAQSILTNLGTGEPDRRVQTVVARGMVVPADPSLLHVVLDNLLSNAWKFTRRTAHARIEVGCQSDGGQGAEVYFVRDNGAGFDMVHLKKMFGTFQRLHHEAEFEGTGIGLAIVQRIIDRHGGRIWAEGAVGSGATFYFTLSPTAD